MFSNDHKNTNCFLHSPLLIMLTRKQTEKFPIASLLNGSFNVTKYIYFFRSYSYYIEVSMEQKDWVRVIDHGDYYCRSWQYLYFEPRVVQYIKIVGTNNTVNKVLFLDLLRGIINFYIYYYFAGFSCSSFRDNVQNTRLSITSWPSRS